MDVPKPTPEMMASLPPEVVALIHSLLARIAELEERLNKKQFVEAAVERSAVGEEVSAEAGLG